VVSIVGMHVASGWEKRFDRFVEPFVEVWRHKKRRQWAPLYLRGLLLPGERQSMLTSRSERIEARAGARSPRKRTFRTCAGIAAPNRRIDSRSRLVNML
jgi:SRSO17 transposase